ncbi:MAG: methyltransferase domain-containing protein [Alphaproteobacteria bacterium]|nr:methyltransferase domain-containing protein [Alphaproteobacteria bacterium]
MNEMNFVNAIHTSTKRDYVARVVEYDKAECAEKAGQWGFDYWDGDRRYGYGGYRYDGRWRRVADAMAAHYGLKAGMRVLDIGCGKAHLLYEFTQAVPGIEIAGLDISAYGVENAIEATRPFLKVDDCVELPYADASFDLTISLNTFHNLKNFELDQALREMTRVSKGSKYFCVESYRNEREKANLLYWQLTCRAFLMPDEWKWAAARAGYDGDVEFITFA